MQVAIPFQLRACLLRGRYMMADSAFRYAPLDVPLLRKLQQNWDVVRRHLAGAALHQHDVFQGNSFNFAKFETFLERQGLAANWPCTPKSKARSAAA